CLRFIMHLVNGKLVMHKGIGGNYPGDVSEDQTIMVKPKGSSRPPCPTEVPIEIAKDYTAACLILSDSPEASAAMSRRCLQHVLRDPNAANVRDNTLAKEIQMVIATKKLPSYIEEGLHAVRHYGNFGAHPTESTVTGEILPVEPGEAEWNLDVLEALFDFYYVQPAALQRKKDALNCKLLEAGKKQIN
ncbi:MAG TPA: DUF4145 domain-containing protein, partial [Methylomirabilota bacterium]|nr:DUF4145 domain-containing protein [Methylomirabilota bacterium]